MACVRRRISYRELALLCEIRSDGRTTKDYNRATGRTNYFPRMTNKEFEQILAFRQEQKNAKKVHISPTIEKIRERFSPAELKLLAEGNLVKTNFQSQIIDTEGQRFKAGVITDTHLGSIYTNPEYIVEIFKVFREQGCDFIFHCGDMTEGMSNRPGHIYELTHLGYEAQKNHAIDIFSQAGMPIYIIDGNHDRWFIKSSGAHIVKDVSKSVKDMYFLGHDEGVVKIGGIEVMLRHGEDSSSYATSYRIQKIVESFTGGEKPNILIVGHTHKQGYFFERNIHCLTAGCIQSQSSWMRGKRIAAHKGFHIIDVMHKGNEVIKFGVEFIPNYK